MAFNKILYSILFFVLLSIPVLGDCINIIDFADAEGVFNGNLTLESNNCFILTSDYIYNLGEDILVLDGQAQYLDCQGNALLGYGEYGIHVKNSADVKNCIIVGRTTGIFIGSVLTGQGTSFSHDGYSTIYGNQLRGTFEQGYGIYDYHSQHNHISSNTITNFSSGIRIGYRTEYTSVRNNSVEWNKNSGIWIDTGDEQGGSIEVYNNLCRYNSNGIKLTKSSNNNITNNEASFNYESGIYLYSQSQDWTYQTSDNYIKNNIFFGNGQYGIKLIRGHNSEIISNQVNNNSLYGVYINNESLGNSIEGGEYCFNANTDVLATQYTDLSGTLMMDNYLPGHFIGDYNLIPCDLSQCEDQGYTQGDTNLDNVHDVLDVVTIINWILYPEDTSYNPCTGDLNMDGTADVMDIVILVGIILG